MTPPTFSGWLKIPPDDWRRVAAGATWDDTWRALLAVPCDAPLADRIVRPGEKHPDHRRKPR